MSLGQLSGIRDFLSGTKTAKTDALFNVTVVAFEDRCNLNCGYRFAELLGKNELFNVTFFNEPFPKGFLNLQGRNFFDFIDRGVQIIKKTQADILIWGYEENGKIRLNFQIENQYIIPNTLTFSLLDSLFVPLNYFSNPETFSESLLLLIYGIIIAAVHPVTNSQIKNRPILLKDIIKLLSHNQSPKDITREFMPYITNMLGKIYLENARNNLKAEDIEVVQDLFEKALINKQYMRLPIYFGSVYNNLGMLYELAFQIDDNNQPLEYLKNAISYYREAQKYLNRNYPYDFGLISYHLAVLYFEFWKHTADLQALRDAVAQLREAEKVYSFAQFPKSWCHIEGLLGYYLTLLGMKTLSNEIMQLAINSYKNQQQIYEQTVYPTEWAAIQEKIGNIYYLLGKQNEDENFMLEARNYLDSALSVYKELRNKDAAKQVSAALDKIKNYID